MALSPVTVEFDYGRVDPVEPFSGVTVEGVEVRPLNGSTNLIDGNKPAQTPATAEDYTSNDAVKALAYFGLAPMTKNTLKTAVRRSRGGAPRFGGMEVQPAVAAGTAKCTEQFHGVI
ncbi:DNA-directed RNA polymerase [Fusarium austroafricanum]|uniref:DNA-directed RNA polymerase n=1 Tax=Fusarium austroafricanum TaxID=2364996 RepID=A0A8H4KL79_9HYPO|nr:DNA-directed RNA polymerase [Fusarium austroafricanum]